MSKTQKLKTVDLVYTALGAVLIAVCSWISVPAPVPFTMQTFAVFAILSILGPRRGTAAIVVYLLTGLVGLPVFSGFQGGPSALLGATGGYLMGFVFTGLAYWLAMSAFGRSLITEALSLLFGLVLCYAFGTAWFVFVYTAKSGPMGVMTALGLCVFPFILPDLLKLALALFVSRRVSLSSLFKKV